MKLSLLFVLTYFNILNSSNSLPKSSEPKDQVRDTASITSKLKSKSTLTSLNKIKSKILKKAVGLDETTSGKENNRLKTEPRKKPGVILHSSSMTDLRVKNSPKSRRKVSRKQSFDDRASGGKYSLKSSGVGGSNFSNSNSLDEKNNSPCTKHKVVRKQSTDERYTLAKSRSSNMASSTGSPRQRRFSLPNVALDKNKTKGNLSARNSPRVSRANCTRVIDDKNDTLFEVHYVAYEAVQREGSFLRNKDERLSKLNEEGNSHAE